jgi:tight adherence protein C
MISVPGMVLGALVAVSLALAVRALLPQRPQLADVLRRTHRPDTYAPPQPASRGRGTAGWADQLGTRLLRTDLFTTRLPARDLSLLELSPASLLGRCALYALGGLLIPEWFLLLASAMGTSWPLGFSLLGGLGCAVFMVFKCLEDIRSRARKERRGYQYYTASLLERVALARNSDAGAAEALRRAVAPGDGRAEARIRDAVEHAQLAGVSAWDALSRLGEELGVPELTRLRASLALAGEEHASVFDQLEAQAISVRRALQADRKGQANEATEKMSLPALAIVFLMAVFLLAPAIVRFMSF